MGWDKKWGTLVQHDMLTVPNWIVDWDKSSFHETKIVKQPQCFLLQLQLFEFYCRWTHSAVLWEDKRTVRTAWLSTHAFLLG